MARRLARALATALLVVGLDQLTKAVAVHYLAGREPLAVIPGFCNLVLVYNRGAAFGTFSQWPHAHWLLIGLSLLALAVMGWVLLGPPGRHRPVQLCLGLICGGALGNLVDRLRLERVIDFIDLHAGSLHWPAFNLADSAITLGGLYLALLLLRGKV